MESLKSIVAFIGFLSVFVIVITTLDGKSYSQTLHKDVVNLRTLGSSKDSLDSNEVYDKFRQNKNKKKNVKIVEAQKKRSQATQDDKKFAYVTLLHGIDDSFKYRGFLYNTLIIKKALTHVGSSADFVVLVGFRTPTKVSAEISEDIKLLISNNIIVHYLPRLLNTSEPISFAEMALLKIVPWSFTQYEKIQFFDGDVMPTKNMDCFFNLDTNAFNTGAASPLNSGWYLAIPNIQIFEILRQKATWRLNLKKWNVKKGWGEKMPHGLTYRDGKEVVGWNFNGASLDQGLLTHFYVINHGNVLLIDPDVARRYDLGLDAQAVELHVALKVCHGRLPTDHFAHFTGRNKPWLKNLDDSRGNKNLKLWAKYLDSLGLPVNSSNVGSVNLKPPLGYFYPNK